ncbi:MAG: AI-2E family transporter [Prevotellaceae bacterium]|jgi:predicted PurR-regulated permease PerM|nr:AI-2E family transporter [Prevotellaceae bacterium]
MKEKYFRYSLITLIVLFGWMIFNGLWAFVNGLLGAFTVYMLVRNQMIRLTEKRKMNKVIAAILVLLEVAVCLFVPVYLIFSILIGRIQDINIDVSELIATVRHFIRLIDQKTGYDVLSASNIDNMTGYLTASLQFIISQISSLIVTTVVIIFLLYFMLINNKAMEAYFLDLLPFTDENRHEIVEKINVMVRSNALGIPLLAVIQGIVAITGYWAAGVPSPVMFGLATGFATIIPIVGTGIVWVPIVIYLALTGNWIATVGLFAYCVIILTNIDNIIRFILQKKMADTHPLITVFGVILGLKFFGFWGIIFGPLLLSMFFLLLDIFKKEYLNKAK